MLNLVPSESKLFLNTSLKVEYSSFSYYITMSPFLCTWMLNMVPSECKLYLNTLLRVAAYSSFLTLYINMSPFLCTWMLNMVPSEGKLFLIPRWELLHTHLFFLCISTCPHFYVHGCWIWFHQTVSYFKLHSHELHIHLFLLCISTCPNFYVHGCLIWFHQEVSYFELPC